MKRKGTGDTLRYRAGDEVEVFYRFNAHGNRDCFPVLDQRAGLGLRPRVAFTDAWVKAFVLEDWPGPRGDTEAVHVCHALPMWTNRYGDLLPLDKLNAVATAAAAASAVHADAALMAAQAGCDAHFFSMDVRSEHVARAAPVPSVSVVVVRWDGVETSFCEEQWGGLSSSVSDVCVPLPTLGAAYSPLEALPWAGGSSETRTFLARPPHPPTHTAQTYVGRFCDEALHACLGPDYEVLSVFVHTGDDLTRLHPAALASRLRERGPDSIHVRPSLQ